LSSQRLQLLKRSTGSEVFRDIFGVGEVHQMDRTVHAEQISSYLSAMLSAGHIAVGYHHDLSPAQTFCEFGVPFARALRASGGKDSTLREFVRIFFTFHKEDSFGTTGLQLWQAVQYAAYTLQIGDPATAAIRSFLKKALRLRAANAVEYVAGFVSVFISRDNTRSAVRSGISF
jgi:hypothetical protein